MQRSSGRVITKTDWQKVYNDFLITGMLDITAPKVVEVQLREDGKVLWINVDGVCRLRACMIGELVQEPVTCPKCKTIIYH